MDYQQLFNALVQFILFTAGAFFLFALVLSHLRYEQMLRTLESNPHALPPEDALKMAVSKVLGLRKGGPSAFAVALLDFTTLRGDISDPQLTAVEGLFRSHLRKEDEIFRLSQSRLGIVLYGTRRTAVEPVMERLLQVVAEERERDASFVWGVSRAGVATYPENGERAEDLIQAAEKALAASESNALWQLAPATSAVTKAAHSSAGGGEQMLDPLTGLLAPQRVGPIVSKYAAARRSQHKPFSMIVFDVDHLARYNQHYGREAGNAILRAVANVLEKSVRETDLIARLGEDELLAVVTCTPTQAVAVGQRVLAAVRNQWISGGGHNLRVTLKAGVAGYPDHGGHPGYLLDKADLALHHAASVGGNVCVLYDPRAHSSRERSPTRF